MSAALWIPLDGAANARDVGGLPSAAGPVQAGRLIRADNLQTLSAADVHELVDVRGVTDVADLRSRIEVDADGAGPLERDGRVRIHHLSLHTEVGRATDVADDPSAAVVFPWRDPDVLAQQQERGGWSYMWFLYDRPDSVLAALRLIAHGDGTTLVHCAAGKDRTGVVVALALDTVSVDRRAIVADYLRTGERIEQIRDRLAASPTYAPDLEPDYVERSRPRAETIGELLTRVDEEFGGTAAWLAAQGWTSADDAALHDKLLAADSERARPVGRALSD